MNGVICGGAPPIAKKKPISIDMPYRVIVPYPFDWRETLGKVTCDCENVVEWYRPWHGVGWRHTENCAIEKHIKRYPGILNFVPDAGGWIAHTE